MSLLLSIIGSLFAGLGWGVLGLSAIAALLLFVFGKVLPDWIAPVLIVLLGAAFVGSNAAKTSEIAQLKIDWANERAILADGKATAERKAREAETALSNKERDLNTTIATNALEKAREQQDHQNRIAAANAVNRSLLSQLSAITAAYHRDAADSDSDPSSNQPPAGEAVKLLADLLGRCEERSVERASFADAAYAAGVACQQDYEAARAATGWIAD